MIPATVPLFVEKYSQDQRDAMAYAYEDRGIRPARRVVELAAAGELTLNGERLEPFTTNLDTVRDQARILRKRRAGELTSRLVAESPRDAVETLRRRLVSLADSEIGELEKQKPGKRDPERMRQLARVVLEASRIPGPSDPRPANERDRTGQRVESRHGLAGALVKAHRASTAAPAGHDQDPTPAPERDAAAVQTAAADPAEYVARELERLS